MIITSFKVGFNVSILTLESFKITVVPLQDKLIKLALESPIKVALTIRSAAA